MRIAISQVSSREKKIHGSLKMKKSDHKQTEIQAHIRGRKRTEAVIKDSFFYLYVFLNTLTNIKITNTGKPMTIEVI